MRLDKYLKAKYPEYSRAFWQKMIASHQVLVNGHPMKVHEKVTDDDQIKITFPAEKPVEQILPDSPLDILYEDTDLLVVCKPPHMVVHPAFGNPTGTLIEQVADHCGFVPSDFAEVIRPGLVHRLDKDTSGCLVIAKNVLSLNALANSLIKKEFDKRYLALVVGHLPAKKGLIDAPIARAAQDRQMMEVSNIKSAKSAQTKFTVLDSTKFENREYSILELELLTGRTHQIRAHLRSIGVGIVGDAKYGNTEVNARLLELCGLDRQALHAWKLSFPHPEKNERVINLAPVPADMAKCAETLGLHFPTK